MLFPIQPKTPGIAETEERLDHSGKMTILDKARRLRYVPEEEV